MISPKSTIEARQYLQRLALVNKDHETRSVWTSIDRPIRPLVYQLHRLGLYTQFSCCGFPYEGADEPKTHHSMCPYVFIWDPIVGPDFARVEKGSYVHHNFLALKGWIERNWKMNNGTTWGIRPFNDGRWHVFYKHRSPNLYTINDGVDLSIHDYEEYILGIMQLSNIISDNNLAIQYKNDYGHTITTHLKMIRDEDIRVIDGNQWYFDNGIEEWQVKPKQDGLVNEETRGMIHADFKSI